MESIIKKVEWLYDKQIENYILSATFDVNGKVIKRKMNYCPMDIYTGVFNSLFGNDFIEPQVFYSTPRNSSVIPTDSAIKNFVEFKVNQWAEQLGITNSNYTYNK